ncbi:MAG: hypothetical protein RML94_16540 [Bacteroidia bacterium]|nr:hypothetical protein [Bacteroidia bacterium]
MWARSACYGLRYRFGASLTLRTADAPSACLTQEPWQVGRCYLFKVLPCK